MTTTSMMRQSALWRAFFSVLTGLVITTIMAKAYDARNNTSSTSIKVTTK